MGYLEQSLPINKAYVIYASQTQKIFLDPEQKCYVFFVEEEAEEFCRQHPETYASAGMYYDAGNLFRKCYCTGALTVVFCEHGREEEKPLKGRVGIGFYNNELNAAVNLFTQTKENRYLKRMAGCYFIVPVRIKPDNAQEIIYATINIGESDFRYLAFSDLEEFYKWTAKVNGWTPLFVSWETMCQICKQRGYAVNAMDHGFFLPHKIMERFRSESTEKDPMHFAF